jgi:hypothetical protein
MVELLNINDDIRMELFEFSEKRGTIVDDALEVIDYMQKNGIQSEDAKNYVNENFLDLLCEFISTGIVSRTVKEIGTSPEYYNSPERKVAEAEKGKETTFTLKKELSVKLGEIYPYIDINVNACCFELKKMHFEFKLAGNVTLKNPGITISDGKIIRAALGTVTPSMTLSYIAGPNKEKKLHTFTKPITFKEVSLKSLDMDQHPGRFTNPAAS